MGFVIANHGLFTLLNSAISGATDLRCLVCTTAGSPTDDELADLNFVSDLASIGLVEAANVNYARQDLASVSLVQDDVGNKVVLSAAAPTMLNVAAGGLNWKRVVYYVNSGSDATSAIIGVDTPATELAPNGGDITLPALVVNVTDVSP